SLRSGRRLRLPCAPTRSPERGPSNEGLLRRRERVRDLAGDVAAGLRHRRLAAATAADDLPHLVRELRRVDADALREVDDDVHAVVGDRGDDGAVGPLLLADAVGEIAQRTGLQVARLS